jgi:hypothetical protein
MRSLTTTRRSISTTAFGIVMITIAFDLTFFTVVPIEIHGNIQLVSWMIMTTGFSIVLCSRLYLVTQNPRALKILIFSILGLDILVYIPTLASTHIPNLSTGQKIYVVAYRLEIIFAVQEVFLAGLYIYFFIRFLKQGASEDPRRMKKTLFFLCTAEAVIIVCDVVLLTLAYTDLLVTKFMVHSFLYAVKLEIEFIF